MYIVIHRSSIKVLIISEEWNVRFIFLYICQYFLDLLK